MRRGSLGQTWLLGVALVAGLVITVAPGAAAAQDDTIPPGIVHEPCEFYVKRGHFEIRARFYDDSPIFDPKVLYRTRSRKWRSVSFKKEASSPDFVATIKRRQLKGVLEYFIEVFDENGNGPARFGSPEAPVRVRPTKRLKKKCVQIPENAAAPVVAETTIPGGETPEEEGEEHDASAAAEMQAAEASSEADTSESEATTSEGEATAAATDEVTGGGDAPAAASAGDLGAEGERPQVIRIDQPPPPPAKQGCAADDAPLYCSPVLWSIVGGVVVVGAATGVGIYFATQGSDSGGSSGSGVIPDRFTLRVSGPDPTGAQ